MLRVLVLIALFAAPAHADQWVSPTAITVASPNKRHQVTVTPADDGKSGATATLNGKTFTMAAPWMPVDVIVLDNGNVLALDHWHQLGHGDVATLYAPDGKVRWKKTLVELLGQAVVDRVPHSVSSAWWRVQPLEHVVVKDSIQITLFDENRLKINLRDGSATVVAVTKLPDDPQRLLNRARALADQRGQEAAAFAALDRAIAMDVDAMHAVQLYIQLAQRTNDHARVNKLLDRISPLWKTKTGYDLANVSVAWAPSLVAVSRVADAERVLRRGAAAAPDYTNPTIALAELLLDQKRAKDADAVLGSFVDRLLQASYLDTFALSSIADFYKQRKELPKALALYLKGYKKDEVTNQFLYAELAKLYEEMGRTNDAIRVYEQLLRYFQKMGAPFANDLKRTQDELDRLHTKPKKQR